jgi:glutaredoxin 3
MENTFIIYTTQTCPWCTRAKELLSSKNLPYKEIDVSDDAEARQQLIIKAGGRRTVPQIFKDEEHIGGYEDLVAYLSAGQN